MKNTEIEFKSISQSFVVLIRLNTASSVFSSHVSIRSKKYALRKKIASGVSERTSITFRTPVVVDDVDDDDDDDVQTTSE